MQDAHAWIVDWNEMMLGIRLDGIGRGLRRGLRPRSIGLQFDHDGFERLIGKIARPKAVILVSDLPKTRSGKIMRRLLRDIAEGQELGDTTTLRDPAVVEEIKAKADGVLSTSR